MVYKVYFPGIFWSSKCTYSEPARAWLSKSVIGFRVRIKVKKLSNKQIAKNAKSAGRKAATPLTVVFVRANELKGSREYRLLNGYAALVYLQYTNKR